MPEVCETCETVEDCPFTPPCPFSRTAYQENQQIREQLEEIWKEWRGNGRA